MKILFIITRADTVGGAQVHVRDLAINLIKSHHNVLIVTGQKGLYTNNLEEIGINFITCPSLQRSINPLKDLKTLQKLIKIIKKFQPDLISTHSSKAGILGRLAAKITNKPCIFTAHGWAFVAGVPQPNRSLYAILEKIVEPLTNKIICVSENDRSLGIKVQMSPDRLIRIYNGMPEISTDLIAKTTINNPVSIVMIARFDQQKDHTTLLKAFQNIPDAQLNLVGDGPNLENVKELAINLDIIDKINFLGYRTDIPEILAKAQIFTLISNWEGFPRTTIEAMRAGLPVIVSDVGGASEAIIEGFTGYPVPRGDVITLHKRLSELVSNTQLRQKMGEQARIRYLKEFTFDKMFDQTFDVYQKVLGNYNKQ
ncbi:MAG TPA: glycosyltransferase family 1 protein [Cyanothece sp. UBA12306]|nr:glycosyltransferase family 1 protein [Cyanothece sp. UBA12306]